MPDLKLVHPQGPAFILPTGGTTGHPKAVLLSHANLLANAWQLHTWTGRRSGKDTLISVIPFFHSYGLSTCLTNGTAMGATLLLHPKFETEVVRRMLDERKPTVFPAVPAMLHVLNQRLREAPVQAKSLMWVISGGAALDPAVASEFAEHTRSRVVQGYGLSECSPVTHAGPLDGSDRPGTIGLPLPDTEAKIVSADGGTESLPPGEVGELMIRGPQVMLGYWNDAAATQAAFRDGWLATGDLATRDADGFFRIVDRKKDLIITSGFNVYPSDVEATIREYPGVHEAAVVGVPDEQRGEVVKAVIAMHPGQACRVQDMAAFLSTRLARHKQPRVIEIVEGDLPRNFLGKVLRRKLRTPGAEVKS
jgi:long-chain acyl-CoA synthetase